MVLSTILAAGFTGADWGMVAAILVLLLLLIFFSLAEMGLSRMTKPKAAAMAEGGVKQAKALQQLVGEPQKWVNPGR